MSNEEFQDFQDFDLEDNDINFEKIIKNEPIKISEIINAKNVRSAIVLFEKYDKMENNEDDVESTLIGIIGSEYAPKPHELIKLFHNSAAFNDPMLILDYLLEFLNLFINSYYIQLSMRHKILSNDEQEDINKDHNEIYEQITKFAKKLKFIEYAIETNKQILSQLKENESNLIKELNKDPDNETIKNQLEITKRKYKKQLSTATNNISKVNNILNNSLFMVQNENYSKYDN